MKAGLDPMEAVERLKSYKAQQDVLERKYKLYTEGEELFALPRTEYPALMSTIKEVKLFDSGAADWKPSLVPTKRSTASRRSAALAPLLLQSARALALCG